jgi:hypothetical protein
MRLLCLMSTGLLALFTACSTTQSDTHADLRREVADLQNIDGPPPSSLDKLYPPDAEAPVLLLKMLGLGASVSGIATDLSENDLKMLPARFDRFKTEYVEVSRLVPEWQERFPSAPVQELGAALNSGDRGRVMTALERVNSVCHDCHMDNMSRVQQKYHWRSFSGIGLTDPATGAETDFRQFMQYMASSFEGINVDLEERQVQNALKNHAAFQPRFKALAQTCEVCHETERKYYIDANMQDLVRQLGAALSETPPDAKLAGELSRKIGMESCLKCHRVHMPAALAHSRWTMGGKSGPDGHRLGLLKSR